MRHFWADCPEFAVNRRDLERRFIISSRSSGAQPRIAAKSGSITFDADANPDRRASLQVGTCELDLSIMLRLQCHDRLDQSPLREQVVAATTIATSDGAEFRLGILAGNFSA